MRLGDPETQPIMMRLKSDLVELIDAAIDGRLDRISVSWDARPALGVVLAAQGYPGTVRTGDVIEGHDLDFGPNVKVFHAASKVENGKVLTCGGRVLTVCALGADLAAAQAGAYAAARRIRFDGMFSRRDIGYRAIKNRARAEE